MKMPKQTSKSKTTSKEPKPECDLCCEDITQDALECEVCLLHMHRYCAGLSRSHYQELLSKSTPFICTVCTQRSQKALIQQLQDEVSALRCELDKLRAASSNSAANKTALEALKDDVQQLKSSNYGLSVTSRRFQPSYAEMTAPKSRKSQKQKQVTSGEPGAALPTPESSSSDTAGTGTGKRKVQVVGAHRVWGTMKDSTVKSVKNVISRVCKIDGGLHVKRKTKDNPITNRTKWWFVIHADEHLLSELDAKWEQVKLQTLWKLEPCFKLDKLENAPTESEIPPTDVRTSETGTDSDVGDVQQSAPSTSTFDENHFLPIVLETHLQTP